MLAFLRTRRWPYLLAVMLSGCATPPDLPPSATAEMDHRWTVHEQSRWEKKLFPGKQETLFTLTHKDHQPALQAIADSSASMLRQRLQVPAERIGSIDFSVYVQDRMSHADLASREKDDSPFRLILTFDGDTSSFSMADRSLSELSRLLTGEPMPYATLMYVWSNQLPVGTVVPNRRTDRIRKLVIQSGSQDTNRWLDYERDIRADYEQVFGEPPGALRAVAIMSDTDNTGGSVRAWYGPVQLLPRP